MGVSSAYTANIFGAPVGRRATQPSMPTVVWTGWEDSTSYSSGQTSIDTDAYTGVVADDLILVFCTIGGGATTPSVASSGLTFTEIAADATGGWDGCKAWYSWAPDSTGRAITMSYGSDRFMGMVVVVVRGADTAAPLDVAGTGASVASSTTPTVAGVTTVTDNAMAFACLGLTENYSPTGPSGWVTDVAQNTSDYSSIAVAHKVTGTAGATGDAVFGATSAIGGHSVTFAVKARQ